MDVMRSPRPSRMRGESSSLLDGRPRSGSPAGPNAGAWIRVGVIVFSLAMVGTSYVAMFGAPKRSSRSVHARDDRTVVATIEDMDIYQHSKKKKKKKKKNDKEEETECEEGDYRKRTLQLAYELPFVALFKERKGQTKFEASSVILVNETVYAVCDSSWSVSKFSDTLTPFGPDNVQIGAPYREEEDSGYEAIFYDEGTFHAVRESIQIEGEYHAVIEELDIQGDDYTVLDVCSTEMEFEGDSKGFEGAIGVRDLGNNLTVLGLCEGNWCSESRKKDKGNGRLVAMSKIVDEGGECVWKTLREIKIPSSAYFTDYSAITMSDNGKVAISSQEDSQVWIGQMKGQDANGLWDVDSMELDSKGKIYSFPKNDNCQTVYCNVEGLSWINDDMLLAVSDKMKKNQNFVCFEKDQSVHAFVLP